MDKLLSAIKEKTARVGVVGLGYVGTFLVQGAHGAGFEVLGIDTLHGEPPSQLATMKRFSFSREYDPISECDVVLICVPTPLTENEVPDLSAVASAVEGIAGSFGKGIPSAAEPKLVVLESTTYPGTTREFVLPRFVNAGFEHGVDIFLAYSPERVDPGPGQCEIGDVPRVVGGCDEHSVILACEFYRALGCRVHPVKSPDAAEMSKMLENIFRAVNIALVNEMSLLCRRMSIDIWEVIEASATKPFGFMSFKPGPGMGGHCIPVDPFYLAWRARQFAFYPEFVELAGKINRNMPFNVVDWTAEALNGEGKSLSESRVLVVGVAYKEDVGDTRESPALKVIELLDRKGADVSYHDSHVPCIEIAGKKYESVDLLTATVKNADCVVIITPHSDLDRGLLLNASVPMVDTRNALGRGG